jgi:hypothetical protein
VLGQHAGVDRREGVAEEPVEDAGAVICEVEGRSIHAARLLAIENDSQYGGGVRSRTPRISGENSPQKEIAMERIAQEIEETEQLAHLSATHSNALVENPFD